MLSTNFKNIPIGFDYLRKGLHVNDIVARSQSGLNPDRLGKKITSSTKLSHCDVFSPINPYIGRILRLLATNHIFREIAPDTFTNNRLSASMDSGKSVKDILAECVSIT